MWEQLKAGLNGIGPGEETLTDDLLHSSHLDDDLDWSWGPRYERLYIWAQVEDPAANEYGSIQVVVQ